MEPFSGSIHLHDWITTPRGQMRVLRGKLEIKSDEEAVGFKARGQNSANWLAAVSGPTEEYIVFGCQIRCVVKHPYDAPTAPDTYEVE